MRCKICNKPIYIKRGFSNFLVEKRCFICDSCYLAFPIHLAYTQLPLDNHTLYIYSLFPKKYFFKEDPFILEFSRVFEYVFQKNPNLPILIYNNFSINSTHIDKIEHISEIFDTNIIIICNYLEI